MFALNRRQTSSIVFNCLRRKPSSAIFASTCAAAARNLARSWSLDMFWSPSGEAAGPGLSAGGFGGPRDVVSPAFTAEFEHDRQAFVARNPGDIRLLQFNLVNTVFEPNTKTAAVRSLSQTQKLLQF